MDCFGVWCLLIQQKWIHKKHCFGFYDVPVCKHFANTLPAVETSLIKKEHLFAFLKNSNQV
jgi:hypothetical protein